MAPLNRRDFLASVGSIGAVWLVADWSDREPTMRHALEQAGSAQPALTFFTREQLAEVDAFTSRIIPTDDSPGAREAGVPYFIDKALSTWAKDQQKNFTEGLAKLPNDVAAKYPGKSLLSSLTPVEQDEVLRSIEQTPFFGAMRFATLAGMFALPSHGGNRDFMGWKLMGQDSAMEFKPPFGYYDAQATRPVRRSGT